MTERELKHCLLFEAEEIQRCRERIEHLRVGATGQRLQGGVSNKSTAGGDHVAWAVCEIDRFQAIMQSHVDRIEGFMLHLDTPAQHRIIRLRYIEAFTAWRSVADAIGYSEKHVQKLHKQALILIADKVSNVLRGIA